MKMLHASSPHHKGTKRKLSGKIKARFTAKDDSPIGHNPRLDTIKMVETTIKNNEVFTSKNQLWRSLPRAMQYPTFLTTLDYLVDSNKIVIEKDGAILWTFVDSAAARQSLRDSKEL